MKIGKFWIILGNNYNKNEFDFLSIHWSLVDKLNGIRFAFLGFYIDFVLDNRK